MSARRPAGPLLALVLSVALVGPAGADPFQDLALVRPGQPAAAPDFTAPTVRGTELRLSELRGSVVFLNFWATWCPPCKEEMPSMERLYRRFKGRDFTIVAVSIDTGDSRKKVDAFARRLGLTFPIGLDPRLEIANRYTVRALPATFLIDRSGRIVALALGPRDWDSRPARTLIERLLE